MGLLDAPPTCPICNEQLSLVLYEGFKILQCRRCKGHLLPAFRLDCIKRVSMLSTEDLKAEASAEFVGGTAQWIDCPRCHRPMRKESLIKGPAMQLDADLCDGCSVVWLDGGELALAQLAYEATCRGMNTKDLQRRLAHRHDHPARAHRLTKRHGVEHQGARPNAANSWTQASRLFAWRPVITRRAARAKARESFRVPFKGHELESFAP